MRYLSGSAKNLLSSLGENIIGSSSLKPRLHRIHIYKRSNPDTATPALRNHATSLWLGIAKPCRLTSELTRTISNSTTPSLCNVACWQFVFPPCSTVHWCSLRSGRLALSLCLIRGVEMDGLEFASVGIGGWAALVGEWNVWSRIPSHGGIRSWGTFVCVDTNIR